MQYLYHLLDLRYIVDPLQRRRLWLRPDSGLDDPRISDALEVAIERGEAGIQVAAYLGNELIVDAGAGTRNGTDPVLPSTLFSRSR